jgi:hypothetical protein
MIYMTSKIIIRCRYSLNLQIFSHIIIVSTASSIVKCNTVTCRSNKLSSSLTVALKSPTIHRFSNIDGRSYASAFSVKFLGRFALFQMRRFLCNPLNTCEGEGEVVPVLGCLFSVTPATAWKAIKTRL